MIGAKQIDLTDMTAACFQEQAIASGPTTNVDWTISQKAAVTLDQNTALTFTNPAAACNLMLKIVQDAVGGHSVSFPVGTLWPGGSPPAFPTAINAATLVGIYFDGATYWAQSPGDAFS